MGVRALGRCETCIAKCQEPDVIRRNGLNSDGYVVVVFGFMKDFIGSHERFDGGSWHGRLQGTYRSGRVLTAAY